MWIGGAGTIHSAAEVSARAHDSRDGAPLRRKRFSKKEAARLLHGLYASVLWKHGRATSDVPDRPSMVDERTTSLWRASGEGRGGVGEETRKRISITYHRSE